METLSKPFIRLAPSVLRTMALARLCPEIRSIVAPTIATAARRCAEGPGAPGWIDMKFDPADGRERDAFLSFYRKDRVYGWIQGRALESFAAHLCWAEGLSGHRVFDQGLARAAAERLYRKIMETCFLPGVAVPSASFVMDPSGAPLGRGFGPGATTLTQLFVLRGILAYASYAGYPEDAARAAAALRTVIDAALRGECLDDQMKFDGFGGESYDQERRGYEGQMISIGACELLLAQSGSPEDAARGLRCVSEVLDRFLLRGKDGQPFIIDALDGRGGPLREGGRLRVNPGHAIEFVGLALQFMRRAARMGFDLSGGSPGRAAEIAEIKANLKAVALGCDRAGRAPHGGIVRSIDAETLEVLNGTCPWWSSFEAARTFGELYAGACDDAFRERCLEGIGSYLSCIAEVYLAPSSIGIPVQTVSFEGKVVPIIPATPDIDAGYHTGIPLLDLYGIAGAECGLRCGAGERRLPPRLGARLQGHIARTKPADGELDPLRARCLWMESARDRALFLSADILEFSGVWAEAFIERVCQRYGLAAESVFLMATHTHTAPCAIDLGLLGADRAFLEELAEAMLGAIEEAKGRLEPSVLLTGASTAKVGVNRRVRDPATGKIAMRPNLGGENDEEVLCVFVFGEDGGLRSALFNVSVHPTTLGVAIHHISADYPGRAAASLARNLGGGLVAIPVQGACGDIRPKVLGPGGMEFAEGSPADVERLGDAVAGAVRRALGQSLARHAAGKLPLVDGGGLKVISKVVELPFAFIPGVEELSRIEEESRREIRRIAAGQGSEVGFAGSHENPALAAQTYLAWAKGLKEKSFGPEGRYAGAEGVRARFSLCSLGPSLRLFSIPGEAFCAIGKQLKRLGGATTIICGYCAGTVGYIPTKEAFAEGGYEVESAYRYYGQPAPLSPETERIIYSLFEGMLEEARSGRLGLA